MKHLIRLSFYCLAFTLSVFFCPKLAAQAPVTSFSQILSSDARAFIFDAYPEEGARKMLFFHDKKSFSIRYMDEKIRHIPEKDIFIPKINKQLYKPGILGMLNLPDRLEIFCELKREKGIYAISIDKENGTYQLIQTPVNTSPQFRTLKTFESDGRFYVLQFDKQGPKTVITIYACESGEDCTENSFRILVPGFRERFKNKRKFFIPQMSEDQENSLASHALPDKLYTPEGSLIFAFEQPELGETQMLKINTNTWRMKAYKFPVEGYLTNGRKQRINSTLYEGLLYQAVVNDSGLTVSVRDWGNGNLLGKRNWENDASIQRTFGRITKQSYQGIGRGTYNVDKLIKHLQKSVAIGMYQLENNKYLLTIGSYRSMDDRLRTALLIGSQLMTLAGPLIGLGIGVNTGFFIDPLSPVGDAMGLAADTGGDRFYYCEAYVDPLSLASEVVIPYSRPDPFRRVTDYINNQNMGSEGKAPVFFEANGKVYYGFGRRDRYMVVGF